MFFLFLALSTVCVFADSNEYTTICREDKYDQCECTVQPDKDGISYLYIRCTELEPVKTTKIVIPRRVFNTFDMEYINIDLFESGITQISSPAISAQLSTKLRSLNIVWTTRNHNIYKIDPEAFDNLPVFETLTISGCYLTNSIIRHDLSLTINNLTSIESNVFDNLGQLRSIDVSHNQIQNIATDAFISLQNLTKVDLAYNKLLKFPSDSLAKIPNLTYLDVSLNPINRIALNDFDRLTGLIWLKLHAILLTEVPSRVLNKLKNLEILYLGGNYIEKIPIDAFSTLNNLRELYLDGNIFSQIPTASLSKLSSLTKLEMARNPINELQSNSFKGLTQLKWLGLSGIRFKNIDLSAFNGLNSLRNIIMSYAGLTEIPTKPLQNLKSLRLLDLSYNHITEISQHHFYGLSHLRTLLLTGNRFKKIQSYAFSNLGNLTKLSLQACDIEYIDNNAFDGLLELKELYLNGNRNLFLANLSFGSNALINLETLDLSFCRLSMLPGSAFQGLPNLWYLNIVENLFESMPTTIRNIRQLYSIFLNRNQISQLESRVFNNSKIYDLNLNKLEYLTKIDDCAFCGLTVWSISLALDSNLKTIHDNAFGFAENSTDKTKKIKNITIADTSIEMLGRNLLPWNKLDLIDITFNPANCNPEMDWLFQNPNLKWKNGRFDRCKSDFCKQFPFYTPCTSTTSVTHRSIIDQFNEESITKTSYESKIFTNAIYLLVSLIYLLN